MCARPTSRTLGCGSLARGRSQVPQPEPQLHPYVRIVQVRLQQGRAPGDPLPHGVAVHGQGDRRSVPTPVQGEPGAQGLGERGVRGERREQGTGVRLGLVVRYESVETGAAGGTVSYQRGTGRTGAGQGTGRLGVGGGPVVGGDRGADP